MSLEQRQRDLLNQWKVTSDGTLKWIADTTARVQSQDTAAIDLDHARAQRQEVEVCSLSIRLSLESVKSVAHSIIPSF